MKEIIVFCPTDVISGGVNSLHNLCASLNKNGFRATMHYPGKNDDFINHPLIKSYGLTQFEGDLDVPDHFIIVPETMTDKLADFKNAKKIVYWLGLKFYFKNPSWKFPFNYKFFRTLIKCRSYFGYSSGIFERLKRKLYEYAKGKVNIWSDDFIHLSNSYFVSDYCKYRGAKNVFVVQNPIRAELYERETMEPPREKMILFGQKTPRLILFLTRRVLKDYQVIRLKRIPFEKVIELMSKSRVFVEFGVNHGRDRMPREAAILGCIAIINNRGSSSTKADYNIDDQYIIKSGILNYMSIIRKIKDSAEQYDKHNQNFSAFKKQLTGEKNNFDNKVKSVFERILNL